MTEASWKEWAHSPSHCFVPEATYIVTAGTYQKKRFFDSPERLGIVLSALMQQANRFDWSLQAWAVLSNHYHFVALAPEDAPSLKRMIQAVHSVTARVANEHDNARGRKVWFQYRDTCITSEKSYLARLHYVHANPVKHRVVAVAENYLWCSMGWFLCEAEAGFRRTVLSFKWDRVSIEDDF